jgi:hypothetical protein
MIEDWVNKGELACGDLMEKAEEVLKEAEKREEAEAKIWIMEGQCEELADLAAQAGKQVPAKAEVEVLEELEEEIDQRKEMVGDLGWVLRETVPEGLKDRMEEAMKESVAIATKGRRYVDHVKTRLDFSKDSEWGSSKAAAGAAPGGWQTATEELGEVFEEDSESDDESEDEAERTAGVAPRDLLDFMRGFGQMQANVSGWPVFDGRYASYPRFKKEWRAYRETYHSAVNNDLAARALRDKCLKGDALQMVSHLDDLQEMWETLDTCYERPEKYMEEALRPIVDFRRYKIADSAAVREFYSLLRAAIKGAKGIGRIGLLINDQTIPKIMGKMPYTDWREWATRRPDWMQQDVAVAFEGFVERKWQDALNIAAAEPASWRGDGEKVNPSVRPLDGTTATGKGTLRITGAVNVVEQGVPSRSYSPSWDVSFGKCRARNLIGCDGDHVMLQCEKLMSLGLSERREVLEKSGLCTFCLKHAAELECYGRGGMSKPRCTLSVCDGEHTPSVHKLMGEENVGVNLVAEGESEIGEDEDEDEDEGWWVGTVGVAEMPDQEERNLDEMVEPEPEKGVRCASVKSGYRLEEEPECPSDDCSADEQAEDEWWSLGPSQPYSVEGGAGTQYSPAKQSPKPREKQLPHNEMIAAPDGPHVGQSSCFTGAKRRRLRKKPETTTDQEWEEVRQDAWLRQMLSDTSSDEDEERYGRFAESGRWMSELFKIPQHLTAISGGECSGQREPEYS